MIQTGKYFEEIVKMLNNFRSEVQILSSLGLVNINKHSENFIKRVLNITYGSELENLNLGKLNFPGIDLGDTGDGVAYQITATKKSDKIDDTLSACLKYKHYETFKTINVFVLTSKQGSYTLKISTEPYFTFSPDKNIIDFSDLLKDIEHLGPSRMKALHDCIKADLQPTIEAINEVTLENKVQLLNTALGMSNCGIPTYCHWQSKVVLNNLNISVPEMHTKLNAFLPSPALKNHYLSILNPALRKNSSNKEILYQQEVIGSGVSNLFYGLAMLVEKSSITIERVTYTDNKILVNLLPEMVMFLTQILFFYQNSKGKFEIEVAVSLESNTRAYFHPTNSLVIDHIFNTFTLESPFELKETLTDINTSTLADLLQKIMHGFICNQPSFISNDPFLTINLDSTVFVINNIKNALGIAYETS